MDNNQKGKGYKFADLSRYFETLNVDEVNLTFEQIENIVGVKLCNSAYKHKEYWYADKTHTLPNCWVDSGYKMTYLDLKGQKVTFVREEEVNGNNPRAVNTTRSESITRKQSTIEVDKVIMGINKFYSDLEADDNSRFLSWEHCYKEFQAAHNKLELNEKDLDYLSLHLAFYLASWGMLRGSSFLLQKDYRVHIEIVKELYKPCYNNLWNIKCVKLLQNSENMDVLMILLNKLKNIYNEKRKNVKEVDTDISDILITKVLLGTMGCVPAYDEYFKKGVAKYNITTQKLGKSSIKGLGKYYEENETELEDVRKIISRARQIEYPQMKILDMAFWQLGLEK